MRKNWKFRRACILEHFESRKNEWVDFYKEVNQFLFNLENFPEYNTLILQLSYYCVFSELEQQFSALC